MALGECCGGPQWLQGLIGFSAAPPGPAAKDQGRQQWWPEPVARIHSALGPAAVAVKWQGLVADTEW